MRKVERLVNLTALLLDTHRPLTLDQIAELVPGYEATGESLRRMFERDKEELRGLGVPVERAPVDAWGTDEGYYIDPGVYAMPALDLAPDEHAALALAARAWSGGRMADAAAVAGLAKLDLDPGARPEAVQANLDGSSPLLATLLEAVTSRKRIMFPYQPPGREPTERHLDPYALVHRRGTWYVTGHDADRGAQRSFRLSRIRGTVRLARPTGRGPEYEVPELFDPRAVLPTAGEPDVTPVAVVRADESAARLAELRGAKREGAADIDGRVTLRLPVGDPSTFLMWAMGNAVEILEPPELRAEARSRLGSLLDLVDRGRGGR